jgi:ferrochelatase
MKQGLLLINLGSPDSPNVTDVRRYLQEFLSDKRVLDLPAPLRFLLLYAFILPFRPKSTAKAYQEIWTKEGSPLIVHGQRLTDKLQTRLGNACQVALGMRYGKPSIATALSQLSECEVITVLPLYPQYASAASGSSIETVLDQLSSQIVIPSLRLIRDFYQHPGFLAAQAARMKPYLPNHDYVLFSYHGIPERQVQRTGCQSICQGNCPPISQNNQACYRAQCFQTTTALATALSLSPDQYSSSFQSRLGKTPWIRPYTDVELIRLAQQGIKRLAIVCPSFVADCLETLEEIGIRAKTHWRQLGGEELTVIPCLNDDDAWVEAIVMMTELTLQK